ncbi:hypothetical protein DEU36_2203 [Microbacterium sp. AG238]|nr:hypothetical protein DEU36_2203 [Microbacterium sp. AG238]
MRLRQPTYAFAFLELGQSCQCHRVVGDVAARRVGAVAEGSKLGGNSLVHP